jgi:hypothetical protein
LEGAIPERISPEARSGSLYRLDPSLLDPPAPLTKAGKTLWEQHLTARPRDLWTSPALVLLRRFVETQLLADRVSAQLRREKDLAGDRAKILTKSVVSLNLSLAGLLVRLRLTPQAAISRKETGKNTEVGSALIRDPLIGGRLIGGHALRQ